MSLSQFRNGYSPAFSYGSSLVVGANPVLVGSRTVVFGNTASATTEGVAIGAGAQDAGGNGVVIGNDAIGGSGCNESVIIGRNATAANSKAIAIGKGATSAHAGCILMTAAGNLSTAAVDTLVLGLGATAVNADVIAASTHSLKCRINGVNYKVLLST